MDLRGRPESALPSAVFSVPKHRVGVKLLHSVILVFKGTFIPYDEAPKTQAKDTLSGTQLEKESFHRYRKNLTGGAY